MDESISGFRVRGTWGDVVEHGERITSALREVDADEPYRDAYEEWDDWRPKTHERLTTDVNEKTAEQASVGEGEGEKAGEDVDDDLQTAGERLSESYEKLEDDDAEGAVEKWGESIGHVARAADTAGRRALRKVENTVYKRVMTQVAPYYFDNDLISANIRRVRGEDDVFAFEVQVNDDDLRDDVREVLHEYDDVERWHVDTEKETDAAAAAEGVEAPPTGGESKPSTN
ncbi:DUF5828 family protein [Halarchaeum nitratireducens]|uniref:Uncharacterized protein n=1 Tax=Halarchaeum nitratireducens TaxID=489913 RepID=A0A830G7A0_9EURY|nr:MULTISPECIES: DUF5828 family protein [Halarchaeum]MBP2251967.1 hypothetical protein [Halarchaeum solikamskense]GGN05745.1 hypothetical protein GCM10009021_00800 [Halarchaeum nitratireducens]